MFFKQYFSYSKRTLSLWSTALLAQADTFDPNKSAGDLASPAKAYNLLGGMISNLLGLALFGGALVAFAYFIWGAFKWIKAGSGNGAAEGRATMLYAAAGMIMLGLVYVVILIYNQVLAE